MKHLISLSLLSTIAIAGCGVKNPDLVGVEKPVSLPTPYVETSLSKSVFFPLVSGTFSDQQDKALNNETTVFADVKRQGTNINLKELRKEDFLVKENGKEVVNFDFSTQDTKAKQVVDIALVIDVTQSMGNDIADSKIVLKKFIQTSYDQGYHTRMCLSTFGDHTVKKCDLFYDIDPDPAKKAEATEKIKTLKSEIDKLVALKGKDDPGGTDFDENPMQALIDASKAQWRSDAQKFVILITDAKFLYSPGNEGHIESTLIPPPTMQAVSDAITQSQISVMAVAPKAPGYSSPLNGVQIAADANHFFEFDGTIHGNTHLTEVLNFIISSVDSSYKFTYDAETFDQANSTLPMTDRHITVELRDASKGEMGDIKSTAQYPDGRPQYKTTWVISDKSVDPQTVAVFLNGSQTPVSSMDYKVVDKSITFVKPPPPETLINVQFYHADIYDDLRMTTVVLNPKVDISKLKITLNGMDVRKGDVDVVRDSQKNVTLTLLPSAAKDNYYKIKENKGLQLEVK